MYKHIIVIEKDNLRIAYSSLKKCCDINGYPWKKLVRRKMPFEFDGWLFNRIEFNVEK